jgi:hypothetical protein
MAQLQDADVVATELEKVRSAVPVLFERDDTFYSEIPVSTEVENISNRDMRIPLEIYPGGDFAHYNPEGGSLGTGSGPKFDKAVINSVHVRHNVQWTKKAEWGTDDPRKAVVKALRHLLSTSMADFRRYLDALCLTNGQGILGTISAVSNAGGYDTVTLGTDGFGARLVRYAQKVAYFDSTLATNRTAGTDKEIVYHDPVGKQIKTATTASLAATDKVVIGGLGNVTGSNVVSLYGLGYHHNNASTGTWLGLDRATLPMIRSTGINAGSTFALPFARRAINAIGDRLGKDQMKKLTAWCHPCQVQAYEEYAQGVMVINKTGSDEKINTYFGDNVQLAGAPVRTHYSWDKTRIDFIAKELWGRAQVKAPDFYEVDGRRIFEMRDTTTGGLVASQIFHIVVGFNLFHKNPAGSAYIYGLPVPTGY